MCEALQGCARVCWGFQWHARVYKEMCKCMQGHGRVCEDMRESVRGCKDMQKRAMMCESI